MTGVRGPSAARRAWAARWAGRGLGAGCWARGAACFVLTAVAACSGDGTGPEGVLNLVVAGGHAQRGLAGDLLRQPVTIRVEDGAGRAVPGVWVHFAVVGGGGDVLDDASVTDRDGTVWTRWRLGGDGVQALEASVEGGVDVTVIATALPLSAADVVVVHGATSPLRGGLLVEEAVEGLQILEERVAPDTILALAPLDAPGPRILIFPSGERPLQRSVAWTPDPDTVHVTLQPPLAVDVRVRIAVGDFDVIHEEMEGALAETESLWRSLGMGITLGSVTYEDATSAGATIDITSNGLCQALTPGVSLQVEIVTQIDGGGIGGYGCDAGYVFLGQVWVSFRNLLAHELGHAFSLLHLPGGLMNPGTPGTGIRDGEIYRAHFNTTSALNTIFGDQPADERRPCGGGGGYVSPCLPMDYVLGSVSSGVAVR